MLEPTRVTVEITMTDEITGRISKTRYRLNQAIDYINGASEYHAQNADWVYQSLDSAVRVHLKAEGAHP